MFNALKLSYICWFSWASNVPNNNTERKYFLSLLYWPLYGC